MDIATMMLMLAIGSFIFALLLVVLKFIGSNRQEVPFWIMAKIHQAIGSLVLFYRGSSYDAVAMLGNAALLIGLSYEAWTIRILAGKPAKLKRWFYFLIATA